VRRSKAPRGRTDALYATALRKRFLAERLSPAEAKELRRRALSNGDLPFVLAGDGGRALGFRHTDPRLRLGRA